MDSLLLGLSEKGRLLVLGCDCIGFVSARTKRKLQSQCNKRIVKGSEVRLKSTFIVFR
jgi:hypothetical protein